MPNAFGNSTSWGDRKRAAMSQKQRTGTGFGSPNAQGAPAIPSFMEGFMGGGQMSPEDAAVSQGYMVKGANAVQQHGQSGPGSYQSYTPLSAFAPGSALNPQMGGGQMQQALIHDTGAMQGAADEQWQANQNQINSLDMLLQGISGRMMGPAQQGAGQLRDLAGQAQGMGRDQTRQIGGMVDKVKGGVDQVLQQGDPSGDIEAAYALSDEATAGFQDAIAKYQDMGAQEASSMAFALRRQGHSAMKMARAGTHPDGSPMTAAEQADAVARVMYDTEMGVQQAVVPYLSRFNDTMVTLRKNLADLRMQGSQTRLAGGQLRSNSATERAGMAAQVGYQGIDAVSNAYEGERRMLELGANLYQAASSLEQAAILNTVNLEMQGRTVMSQLVQQNPRSVVSWLQGLLAIAAAEAAGAPAGGGGYQRPTNAAEAYLNLPDGSDASDGSDGNVPRGTQGGAPGYNRRTTPRTPDNDPDVAGPPRGLKNKPAPIEIYGPPKRLKNKPTGGRSTDSNPWGGVSKDRSRLYGY